MRLFKSIILGLAAIPFSCSDEQPSPVSDGLDLVPISYTEAGFTKILAYNNQGKLTQIHYTTTFSDGNTLESFHDFTYHSDGRVAESKTDTGWKFVYTYNENKIVKTEEYIQGVQSDVHTFRYDPQGKIVERITYQDIPEEGGVIPVSKETYEYDQNDNLIIQRLYYYTSYAEEAKLLSEFEYSDYDNKINSEEFFDIIGINPLVRLRKNNPGLMVLKNDKGNVSITEKYRYTYHEKGYPIRKLVDITHYDGTTGSYEASYSFKE